MGPQKFCYGGMIARTQLAAPDFNSGSDLEVAKTKAGNIKANVNYSKMTKNWSAKPIKVKKSTDIFHGMVERTLSLVKDKKQLSPPVIPQLPQKLLLFQNH